MNREIKYKVVFRIIVYPNKKRDSENSSLSLFKKT